MIFEGVMIAIIPAFSIYQEPAEGRIDFDEFPTIYFNNIDSLIATARSNKVSTALAIQNFSQLKKDYGAEQPEVITPD